MRKYLDEEVPDSHGITECGLFMHHILEEYEKGNMQLDELVPYYEENFDKQVVYKCQKRFLKICMDCIITIVLSI